MRKREREIPRKYPSCERVKSLWKQNLIKKIEKYGGAFL
jgi:hypothetical protein